MLSLAPCWKKGRLSGNARNIAILDYYPQKTVPCNSYPHIPKRYMYAAYNKGENYYQYWDKCYSVMQSHNFYLGDYIDSGAFSYCFEILPRKGVDRKPKVIKLIRRSKETQALKLIREISVLYALAGGPGIIRFYGLLNDIEDRLWKPPCKHDVMIYHRHENFDDKKPNLPDRIRTGAKEDKIAMVFEKVDCETWKSLMPKRDGEFLKRVFFQLLISLDFAHSRGIFHNDIKDKNVLITEKAEKDSNMVDVVIIDWGQADYYIPSKNYTKKVGTPHYRSPEIEYGQVRGHHDYSTDIWSAGILILNAAAFDSQRHIFDFYNRKKDNLLKAHSRVFGTKDLKDYLDRNPGLPRSKNAEEVYAMHDTPRRNLHSYLRIKKGNNKWCDQLEDLLNRMLVYDPTRRITALEALEHPYFESARQYYKVAIQKHYNTKDNMDLKDEDWRKSLRAVRRFFARRIKNTTSEYLYDELLRKNEINGTVLHFEINKLQKERERRGFPKAESILEAVEQRYEHNSYKKK